MLIIQDAIFSDNQVIPRAANGNTWSDKQLYLGKRSVERADLPGLPINLSKSTGSVFDCVIIPKNDILSGDLTVVIWTCPTETGEYVRLISETLKAGTKGGERGNIIKLPAGLREWVKLSYMTGGTALTNDVTIFAGITLGVDDVHPAV